MSARFAVSLPSDHQGGSVRNDLAHSFARMEARRYNYHRQPASLVEKEGGGPVRVSLSRCASVLSSVPVPHL